MTDLYFIGFAPYASEDVFRKELEVIHPLMDQRFDTGGRSLRLVNNDETLRDFPIATMGNLRRALAGLARRMDTQEDVLVLYVTTHGSRNAVLAVELPPLQLYNIDPPALKRMLDEAGIRNRVLIISACYSGSFIPELRGPDTLIMTAVDRRPGPLSAAAANPASPISATRSSTARCARRFRSSRASHPRCRQSRRARRRRASSRRSPRSPSARRSARALAAVEKRLAAIPR